MVPTVGLTGGIACGKSTVAQMFAALGVPIVDADGLAREVVLPGTEGLAEVVRTFGAEILDDGGHLDRKKLGDRIFADPKARATLNGILHPRIGALSAERIAELSQHGTPYLIYEAALLVENGIHRAFPALVVVTVDPETQLRRLMARDMTDAKAAGARIDAQLPLENKIAVADYVIDNSGEREDTELQVGEVHAALLLKFQQP
ncbi:MAG: dephospho-CoA kinase [Myxococcota bacterium]